MGNGYMKDNTNAYFRARKMASQYNEKLCSREGASEELGVSPSTLADYELGLTKVVPVDNVMRMAELYNCPELKSMYCKNECPIGKNMPIATEVNCIEQVALELIRKLDPDELKSIQDSFADIALDGKISDEEKKELGRITEKLDELSLIIGKIKLLNEKA